MFKSAIWARGGVWRVIIPVLLVKGKNSCVQLFLPFFWRANWEFYEQKKRTQSLAFNIHYLQLSDHYYGGAAATGYKRRLKRGWPWVYALDIEWSLMNKLSLFRPNSPTWLSLFMRDHSISPPPSLYWTEEKNKDSFLLCFLLPLSFPSFLSPTISSTIFLLFLFSRSWYRSRIFFCGSGSKGPKTPLRMGKGKNSWPFFCWANRDIFRPRKREPLIFTTYTCQILIMKVSWQPGILLD